MSRVSKNLRSPRMSLRSRLTEEQFRSTDYRSLWTKRSNEEWIKHIERVRHMSDDPYPNPGDWIGQRVDEYWIDGMQVFCWGSRHEQGQPVLIYFHGGGFLYPPLRSHFEMVDKVAKGIGAKVVFPLYGNVPDHNYKTEFAKILTAYETAFRKNPFSQIVLGGDSAGGSIALGFSYYLRDRGMTMPEGILLFSPWVDLHTDNPDIEKFENVDPMLDAWGLGLLGIYWADGEKNLDNPYVSPIFADPKGISRVLIFCGTHDILYPDVMKLDRLFNEYDIDHNTMVYPNMDHVFVAFPIPEARVALDQAILLLKDWLMHPN